jgi:hypothetical protein
MVPRNNQEIDAVLCYCHGYTDHASFIKQVEYSRFCEHKIAVVAIEYEGHGRSDGELGLVYDWNLLIDDVYTFFKQVTSQKFPGKKVFLMGEVGYNLQVALMLGITDFVLTTFDHMSSPWEVPFAFALINAILLSSVE